MPSIYIPFESVSTFLYITCFSSLLQPGIVDTFFIKKNGKGIMKESYSLAEFFQDTAEQLGRETGASKAGKGAE